MMTQDEINHHYRQGQVVEAAADAPGNCALPKALTTPIHMVICELRTSDLRSFLLTRLRVAVSPQDFPPPRDGSDILLLLNDLYVFSARPYQGFPPGQISLSDAQRTWAQIALSDVVTAQIYDPFSLGGQAYLGSLDMEVGFASLRKRTDKPYDQDELAQYVIKVRR